MHRAKLFDERAILERWLRLIAGAGARRDAVQLLVVCGCRHPANTFLMEVVSMRRAHAAGAAEAYPARAI